MTRGLGKAQPRIVIIGGGVIGATRALRLAGRARLDGIAARRVPVAGGRATGVATDLGEAAADAVILASGPGTPALLALLGLALDLPPRPGPILRTAPVTPLLRHILVTPDGEARHTHEGHLLMPVAVDHQADTAATITLSPAEATVTALARLARVLPDAALLPGALTLGHRPVPPDGLPLVGPVPGVAGLQMALMPWGVTLAAIVGECPGDAVPGGPIRRRCSHPSVRARLLSPAQFGRAQRRPFRQSRARFLLAGSVSITGTQSAVSSAYPLPVLCRNTSPTMPGKPRASASGG
jgi:glycine/D-amino acid oxidase-like deaminating enzyme